jgi:hypothetical protein
MTCQYLAGELSALVGELKSTAAGKIDGADLDVLRREVETVSPTLLPSVARRVLDRARSLCWESLSRGDMVSFGLCTSVCANLRDFVVCAGLVDEEAGEGQ